MDTRMFLINCSTMVGEGRGMQACTLVDHYNAMGNTVRRSPSFTVTLAAAYWQRGFRTKNVYHPVLPLLVFFRNRARKAHQKRIFMPTEPLKSLEKKRKTFKKTRTSSQGNKKQ